jgi:hypothetical protein
MEEYNLAFKYCLEIINFKKDVEALYINYKQKIISALNFALESEKIQDKNYVIINGKEKIQDKITGKIASIVSGFPGYNDNTTIVIIAHSEKNIKVSARNVRQGRNLKTLMQKVIDSLDHGKMKGHTNAVACILERDYEERFLQKLTENLKVETVKF